MKKRFGSEIIFMPGTEARQTFHFMAVVEFFIIVSRFFFFVF